jgi:hypothetical protein
VWLGVVAVGASLGCDTGPPAHPDTGYGANQPVPAVENCVDACQRIGDCSAELCSEDTNNPAYAGAAAAVAASCESTCTDTEVMSAFPLATWQCIFTDSCRQVFGEDSCHAMGHYNCG